MGNLIFCDEVPKEESVINLSESCVNRLTSEESDNKNSESSSTLVTEDIWMKKIKSFDDCHSYRHKLRTQDVDDLFEKVGEHIGNIGQEFCRSDLVINCLNKNKNPMANCKSVLDDFIECVDTVRFEKLKERFGDDSNLSNKNEANVGKEYLKSK